MTRIVAVALALVAVACGDSTPAGPAATTAPGGCADVVDVTVRSQPDGTYTFAVTVSSADTGWDKYADAWEVVGLGGEVLGTRVLAHPHVDEQPFTRSLAGVVVPAGVAGVTVRARDSVAGFCGAEMEVELPGS